MTALALLTCASLPMEEAAAAAASSSCVAAGGGAPGGAASADCGGEGQTSHGDLGRAQLVVSSPTLYSAGALDALPEEVLARVWTFLDPETIARASTVCKRFRNLGRDLFIWEQVAENEGLLDDDTCVGGVAECRVYGGDTQPPRRLARSEIVRRFQRVRRARRAAEHRWLLAERRALEERRQTRVGAFLRRTLLNRPQEFLELVLVVCMSVLLPLRLDGHVRALPWSVLLYPLLHTAGTLATMLPLYDVAAAVAGDTLKTELTPLRRHAAPVLYYALIFGPLSLARSLRSARAVAYPLVFSCAALLALVYARVLVAGRAEGGAEAARHYLPMPLVLGPLVPAAAALSALLWGVGPRPRKNRIDRAFLQGVLLVVLAGAALLALRADADVAWSWHAAAAPLYAADAAVVLAFVLGSAALSCCKPPHRCVCRCRCCPRRVPRVLQRHTFLAQAMFWPCLGALVLTLVPLAAFEVLLAFALGGSVSFTVAFVPLFVVEGALLILYAFVNVQLWTN